MTISKSDIDKLYELQKRICKKLATGNGDYYDELIEQEHISEKFPQPDMLHSIKVLLNYCTARALPRETADKLFVAAGFNIT